MRAAHPFRCLVLPAFLGAIAVVSPLDAQKRRPMTLIDLAELPRVIGPQISPDGRTVAYFLSGADWKAGRLVFHLWRQDVAGGAPTQLTFTEGGDIPVARWSPDGKTLLFLREGQISLLPADGGESRVLTRHATSVSAAPAVTPTWSPDGAIVYFVAADPATADERERNRARDDVFAVDENYKQRHIWKIVVATGVETQITSGDSSVAEYKLSSDGRRLAVQRAPSPLLADAARGEVWVMDAGGENARALTSNAIEEGGVELSPDNSQMLFTADTNERMEPYYPKALFVVPAAGGAARLALPETYPYAIEQAAWSPDGRSIVANVNMGVHSELVLIDPAGRRAQQLTDGEHFIPPGWAIVPSAGKIVLQYDEPTRFGEVWTLPIGDRPAEATRVTHRFDRLEREVALPRQQKVSWKKIGRAHV